MKALTLSFALLFLCTGAVLAQTPDGTPPSGETVCAGQLGAAHGLCTAYCEAMDCDAANPQASPTACTKVRGNFMKHTGEAPPCDCPCVSQVPGWIDFVNGPIEGCHTVVSPTPTFDGAELDNPGEFVFAQYFPEGGICASSPSTSLIITLEQARTCVNLLRQRAAALGLTCQPLS